MVASPDLHSFGLGVASLGLGAFGLLSARRAGSGRLALRAFTLFTAAALVLAGLLLLYLAFALPTLSFGAS